MSTLQLLLVLVGISLLTAVVVVLLVGASSWTRSGRASAAFEGGALLVVSGPPLPDPARLPGDISSVVAGGGVSARW